MSCFAPNDDLMTSNASFNASTRTPRSQGSHSTLADTPQLMQGLSYGREMLKVGKNCLRQDLRVFGRSGNAVGVPVLTLLERAAVNMGPEGKLRVIWKARRW